MEKQLNYKNIYIKFKKRHIKIHGMQITSEGHLYI